jgi:hypothetical protein
MNHVEARRQGRERGRGRRRERGRGRGRGRRARARASAARYSRSTTTTRRSTTCRTGTSGAGASGGSGWTTTPTTTSLCSWRAPDSQLWRGAGGVTGASRRTEDEVVLHFAEHHLEHHFAMNLRQMARRTGCVRLGAYPTPCSCPADGRHQSSVRSHCRPTRVLYKVGQARSLRWILSRGGCANVG